MSPTTETQELIESPQKGERIVAALRERITSRDASCHSDGPSYNDHSGDITHNKACD